mgnify:CR=1 FL=1
MDYNLFYIVCFSFLIGFFASTIAAGPVSLLVFRNSFLGDYIGSFFLIIGSSIMESIYCVFSLTIINLFLDNSIFEITSKILSVFILLFVGLYLFKKSDEDYFSPSKKNIKNKSSITFFFTGFLLILFNPTIILTWYAASTTLIAFKMIKISSVSEIVVFSVFALIGTVCGGLIMIVLVKKFKGVFSSIVINRLFKLIGVIVITVSVYLIYDFILLYVF